MSCILASKGMYTESGRSLAGSAILGPSVVTLHVVLKNKVHSANTIRIVFAGLFILRNCLGLISWTHGFLG